MTFKLSRERFCGRERCTLCKIQIFAPDANSVACAVARSTEIGDLAHRVFRSGTHTADSAAPSRLSYSLMPCHTPSTIEVPIPKTTNCSVRRGSKLYRRSFGESSADACVASRSHPDGIERISVTLHSTWLRRSEASTLRRLMESLIERAKAGDAAAMEQLLATVAPSIQRFGIRMCRNEDDAEDVLQEALLTIAHHLQEFEGRSSFSSWAFALARSACSRKRRGLKNQPQSSLDDMAEGFQDAPSPEQQVADREMAHALNRALDQLAEDYREVILLRDVEDLTAPEAAKALGVSVQALKSRLHRARQALREALRPALEPMPVAAKASCPDVFALWSRKLEGDLSAVDCAEMEKHVEQCSACASACSALKAALFACRSAGAPKVTPELRASVHAAVRKWLDQGV